MSIELLDADDTLILQIRKLRTLIIHPDEETRTNLVNIITRVGCEVSIESREPEKLDISVDLVFFLLDRNSGKNAPNWMRDRQEATTIAILPHESPELVSSLYKLNTHGILLKPIRIFNVLAVLSNALSTVRHEKRLKKCIQSLDETLKARRMIERATEIISKSRNMSESESYEWLRAQLEIN